MQSAWQIWSCRHTSRFPRDRRFVLGERIERRPHDLPETLLQARYPRDRQPLPRQANLRLEVLRLQTRLAHDLQRLPTNSYGFASGVLQETGRMIGGWLEAPAAKPGNGTAT